MGSAWLLCRIMKRRKMPHVDQRFIHDRVGGEEQRVAEVKLIIGRDGSSDGGVRFESWHFSRRPNQPADLRVWADYVSDRELGHREPDSPLYDSGVKIMETTSWIMDLIRQAMPANTAPLALPTMPKSDDLFDDAKLHNVPNYDAGTVRNALRIAVDWAEQCRTQKAADQTGVAPVAQMGPAITDAKGETKPESPQIIVFDQATDEIRWHNHVLAVARGKPSTVMGRLVNAGVGVVVSYLDLANAVTPGSYAATINRLDRAPEDVRDAVKACSALLRKAGWPFEIESVRTRGYRLRSLSRRANPT